MVLSEHATKLSSAIKFSQNTLSGFTIRLWNGLDLDQTQHFVYFGLCPICLQM